MSPIIVRTPSMPTYNDIDKLIANAGCGVCPYCGSSKELNSSGGKITGISAGIIETALVGGKWFSRGRLYIPMHTEYRTCYKCFDCGSEWKSRPYIMSDRLKDHYFQFDVDEVMQKIASAVTDIESAIGKPLNWL